MQAEPLSYSLTFDAFAIDFLVDEILSKEQTSTWAHSAANGGVVFVVADTWLRIGDTRHLLVSEFETGNLIEALRSLAAVLREPMTVPQLEHLIPRGGLYAWKRSYWNRLQRDLITSEDEEIYNVLAPVCIMAYDGAGLAAYRYEGRPTLEAASHSGPAPRAVTAWCEFDPTEAARQVDELFHTLLGRFGAGRPS